MATRSPIMNVMVRAADRAARGLKRDFGEVEQLQVSRKGPADFVSSADLKAEQVLREELGKARPDHGFLMEETGAIAAGGTRRWIVDPL
ncbi:MAG TPA: inositol monophosphatase family protein, partial [Kiloniellales bacterium]|nr:inositol monophosphatase family protein [Kiloniellales bacterium]